ncbi:tRNA pseudouridine(38-40) synthase TruA [Mucilaginibacter sp. X4EP1]|uniref:tRNA pseudouridine(38-40) synthase TruA n=1 Tax=Mucilaginibacter sp. X4EP1 TaxID=2723092 RepID=UPI002168215D|nr:tRNA pseudouridine(38-40) synthase TruA [Mucilaginibacter sp. X4EP1]MCS3813736.1 tRNA pseudouridine38-40 synthase [Mucilaginibacter sp. X4EP1]
MTTKQRYFIELAYDGTHYHGWQTQPNAVAVQEVLNEKLSIILRQPIETLGCGRTDTGVHAKEFFAHFDAEGFIDDSSLFIAKQNSNGYDPSTMKHELKTVRSLNSILPKDIAIKNIIPVAADAHARFDATLRSYEYHIHFNKDPFKNGYSWELRDRPDVELMNTAASIIMKYTDFSCFSKSNTQVKTNICKVNNARWEVVGDGIVFKISADRFLRNMVRAIVGTLLMVGKHEIEPDAVRTIIESKNRSNAGTSVPACGLYLTEVKYPPNRVKGEF